MPACTAGRQAGVDILEVLTHDVSFGFVFSFGSDLIDSALG